MPTAGSSTWTRGTVISLVVLSLRSPFLRHGWVSTVCWMVSSLARPLEMLNSSFSSLSICRNDEFYDWNWRIVHAPCVYVQLDRKPVKSLHKNGWYGSLASSVVSAIRRCLWTMLCTSLTTNISHSSSTIFARRLSNAVPAMWSKKWSKNGLDCGTNRAPHCAKKY